MTCISFKSAPLVKRKPNTNLKVCAPKSVFRLLTYSVVVVSNGKIFRGNHLPSFRNLSESSFLLALYTVYVNVYTFAII